MCCGQISDDDIASVATRRGDAPPSLRPIATQRPKSRLAASGGAFSISGHTSRAGRWT